MKYSQKELKEMADYLLSVRNSPYYMEFLLRLSVTTGVSPDEAEQKILEYAAYEGD